MHRQLIEHRDQLYAHTDATGVEIVDRGKINQVRFLVTPDGTVQLFAPLFQARPPVLPRVGELCKILREKTRYHINKLQKRHLKKIPPTPGEYMINVLDKDGPFVIKSAPFLEYML